MAEAQPKYLYVADTLRREIAEGVFRDGQTLMTEEELRVRFQVSRQTVRQAIALLEDDGLVDRRRGSGTYVRHGPRKRQGTIHVGVITTYITDYIFPSIVSGMETVLSSHGAVMSLSATYNSPTAERKVLERMLDGQVDGLIVEGVRTASEMTNEDCYLRLMERNIPVIFINGYYRKLRNIPHVVMDDYGGGCQAAREILRRGYVRSAGMFKTDDLQGQEREAGLTNELRSRGISIPEECMLRFGTEHRMDLFETREGMDFVDTLASGKADCVVCYNDVFASNLMERLRQKGVKLPEDLGVIGFDNSVHAAMNRPALTTLGHPMETFGELTALKILNMIDGEKEKSVRMPWTLIERDSLPDRNR